MVRKALLTKILSEHKIMVINVSSQITKKLNSARGHFPNEQH